MLWPLCAVLYIQEQALYYCEWSPLVDLSSIGWGLRIGRGHETVDASVFRPSASFLSNEYLPTQQLSSHLVSDMYFFFCGWHLLFSVYMILGIPSTGSAGLIQTVGMFSQGHIVAGVLGAVASAGWTLQGLGNAFYYRMVSVWF
jgi:hypothetical protein